ncbi:class I histocompatibility antigen, F10 alpha chain-like [Excalfactoria chinensis]|uniref:class I histocompatibility antigen, F10 alpha chain-like n=1 Tax=Excalfactoria chinensis TaxID=46218 RepID=UPI003B3A9E79
MTDPGPGLLWFVSVRYVDGEIFVHYDNTTRRFVPRTEWMKAAGAVDPEYWDRNTRIAQSSERNGLMSLDTLQERYNRSGDEYGRHRGSMLWNGAPWRSVACTPQGWSCPAAPSRGCLSQPHRARGSHTLQRMYGCDILEDGTTWGYRQVAYDGRDFIAFDKDTTTAVPEAVPTKRKWEAGSVAERQKHYLEETCVQLLWKYLEHGKAELGMTEQPEVRVWGKEADGILTLSCRAHGFYPRPIAVSWVKDGAVLGQDTHSGGIVPNSDGTYHTWVTIEALPGDGDKYQCRVEHASLPQPGLYSWEQPQSNVVPIMVGVVIAIVAIAIMAGVGFIIYRHHAGKKEKGYNVAPSQDGASSNSSTGSNQTI